MLWIRFVDSIQHAEKLQPENFSIEEQNEILAAGRSNNFLETTRLKELYPEVNNIKDSVREILISMKWFDKVPVL